MYTALVLGVKFGTLNMYFQTGLKLDIIRIYLQMEDLYTFYLFLHFELYVRSFKCITNIYLLKLNNRYIIEQSVE